MPITNYYEGITHTIFLSTANHSECEDCGKILTENMFRNNIARHVNHYIKEHGYKILSAGQEISTNSENGKTITPVAVLLGR